MKKNILKLSILVFVAMLLTSCATANHSSYNPYDFFGGFIHGYFVIFSWIGSLFSDNIIIYSCNNNGGWYDFGFMLGIGGIGTTVSSKLR